MPLLLDVTSPASVSVVLDAIRTKTGYWQDSLQPPELRKFGLQGVEARVSGTRFEVFVRDFGDPPAGLLVVRGDVAPTPSGGSRVRARAGQNRYEWFGVAIFALLGTWSLMGREFGAGVFLLSVAGFSAWYAERAIAQASRGAEPGINHLVERLKHALATVNSESTSRAV